MSKKKNNNPVEIVDFDVAIPVYSNYEFIIKNLEFLRTSAGGLKYNVYITDDCSPDYKSVGEALWKQVRQDFPEVKSILVHRQNTGYGKSVNDAAHLGKAPFILILNSDILLLPESIKFMIDHMRGAQEVGITFPKLLFFPNSPQSHKPAGKIQHCGIVFDINGNPYHNMIGWEADHPFVNSVKDYNACTGACFIIRRKIWEKLNGYDLSYGKGYFEDVDLCLKVRLEKYLIRYLPMSVGYHFTNASTDKFGVEAFGDIINRNNYIFKQKWEKRIPYDEFILNAM